MLSFRTHLFSHRSPVNFVGLVVTATILTFAFYQAASAQTLFSNFAANNVYDSGNAYLIDGPTSINGSGIIAFQFVPSVSGIPASVDVPLALSNGSSSTTVTIATNSVNSTPSNTVLFTATRSNIGAQAIYNFASTDGQILTAGTPYWIYVNPSTTGSNIWFFASPLQNLPSASSNDNANSFTARTPISATAFRVNAAIVPEYSSLSLLIPGLLVIARCRKASCGCSTA